MHLATEMNRDTQKLNVLRARTLLRVLKIRESPAAGEQGELAVLAVLAVLLLQLKPRWSCFALELT